MDNDKTTSLETLLDVDKDKKRDRSNMIDSESIWRVFALKIIMENAKYFATPNGYQDFEFYCSVLGYETDYMLQKLKQTNKLKKSSKIKLKCNYCGKNVYKYSNKIHDVNFCDKQCFLKWHEERRLRKKGVFKDEY